MVENSTCVIPVQSPHQIYFFSDCFFGGTGLANIEISISSLGFIARNADPQFLKEGDDIEIVREVHLYASFSQAVLVVTTSKRFRERTG